MNFATVAEAKNRFSEYLDRANRTRKPLVVTRHGKPYMVIRPVDTRAMEDDAWGELSRRSLAHAWVGDEDKYYDYL